MGLLQPDAGVVVFYYEMKKRVQGVVGQGFTSAPFTRTPGTLTP
jgi:hypothetical protein